MARNIAIVTTESLPCFPRPCAGGGVRVWGLGEALRRQGLSCLYFLPESLRHPEIESSQVPIQFYKPEFLHQELRNRNCEAALFEQWQPLTFLKQPLDIPIILDLPGPLILEYYWRDRENFYSHIVEKVATLSQADYFLCALERQRSYYSAWLTWAGLPPDAERLAVVPLLLHEMPQSRQGHVEDEPQLFWGGMFWPWQERTNSFRIILEVLSRLRCGQLVISGGTGGGEKDSLYAQYADHPHVSWLGRLCFSEYAAELKRAAVAIDLSRPTEERRLSSDLRTGTALWAGAPCLTTSQSPWAEWIQKLNAGWVLDYEDEKGLRELITEIVLERVDITAKRRGAKEASLLISNDDQLKPLLNWLQKPEKRNASLPFFEARFQDRENRLKQSQEAVNRLQHENAALRHDLDSIRANPLFRLYKKLTGKSKK